MPLPENFNDWEHFSDVLRQVYNREVRKEFSDADDDDISTPRNSLKQACLIKDNDNEAMISARMNFYYYTLRKAQDLQQPVYSIPIEDYDSVRKYRPQVLLFFKEDYADLEDGYQPITGRISFRLMDETSTSLTKAELTTIATRIKTQFGNNSQGYIWRRGKDMAVYTDKPNGYDFKLLVRNINDAKELVEKVLDIDNKIPDWQYLTYKENGEPSQAFPTLPPLQNILGTQIRMPRRRPIASVRFQYSVCQIHGRGKPVPLYDRILRFRNALKMD